MEVLDFLQSRDPADKLVQYEIALHNLPISMRHKALVWCLYVEGYTQEQLAAALGVSQPAVSQEVAHIRQRIIDEDLYGDTL